MLIKQWWPLILSVLIIIIGHEIFFVGFIFSDDDMYMKQAQAYLSGDFSLPIEHWGFRYTVILPLSFIGLFIDYNDWILSLVPLIYWIALLFVIWFFIANVVGKLQANISGLFIATMPIFVIESTILGVDIAEAFFLFVTFICFYYGETLNRNQAKYFFFAGISLGFAMLTRETAYGFLLVLGVFFILGGYRNWKLYSIGLLGVLAILSLEWAYYLSFDQGIMYRIQTMTQSHGSIGIKTGDFASGTGNISDNRFFGPLLAVLINQEFALLYWAAIASSIYIYFYTDNTNKQLLRYVLIVFSVYFIWISYSGALRPLPRYYCFLSVLAIIPIVIAISEINKTFIKVLFIGIIIGSNIMSLSVENIYPKFIPKTIAKYIITTKNNIVVNSKNEKYIRWYLSYYKSDKNLVSNKIPKNKYFIYAYIEGDIVPDILKIQLLGGNKIKEFNPPKLLIGHILDITGIKYLLPNDLYHYLAIRNPKVTLYKLKV